MLYFHCFAALSYLRKSMHDRKVTVSEQLVDSLIDGEEFFNTNSSPFIILSRD